MSEAPIVYRFIAAGPDAVVSAFKSVETAAVRSAKAAEQSAKQTARAVAAPRAARASAAGGDAEAKAAKRAADAQAREAKRAADAKIREHERALKHVAGVRDRHFRDEQRANERQSARKERDDAKWIARANAKYVRERRAKFQNAGDWAGAGVGAVGNLASKAGYFGLGVGLSSVGVVGQAARESMSLHDNANRLSIASRGAGEGFASATAIRKQFEAAAIANPGVKASDVAAGAAGFVAKTGDRSAAMRFSGTFATVASASGASVEDISNAAADLFQKFDITSIEEMQSALAALTMQGKAGAFEIKDAASQFAKMSAAASRFGVDKGAEGVKVLGGLTQIARSATGSPEQAATAVEATFRQLVSESAKIKGMGVDVFQKGSTSKTRDVRDVITDVIAKSGGSLPKLQKIFGEEGIRGVSPLISAFNQAKNGATGSEAEKTAVGVKALRDALAKAIDAPGDWSEVLKDQAQAQMSAGAQLDAAWEQVKAAVANDAVPALQQMGPAIKNATPALIGAIDSLTPAFEGLGVAIGSMGQLVKDLQVKGIIPTYETAERDRKRSKPGEEEKLSKTDPRRGGARVDMMGLEGIDAINAMMGRGPGLDTEDPHDAMRASQDKFWASHQDNAESRALFNSIMAGGQVASDAYGATKAIMGGETPEQEESRKGLAGTVASQGTDAQSAKAIEDAAMKLSRAADKLAGANQPSVVSGTD